MIAMLDETTEAVVTDITNLRSVGSVRVRTAGTIMMPNPIKLTTSRTEAVMTSWTWSFPLPTESVQNRTNSTRPAMLAQRLMMTAGAMRSRRISISGGSGGGIQVGVYGVGSPAGMVRKRPCRVGSRVADVSAATLTNVRPTCVQASRSSARRSSRRAILAHGRRCRTLVTGLNLVLLPVSFGISTGDRICVGGCRFRSLLDFLLLGGDRDVWCVSRRERFSKTMVINTAIPRITSTTAMSTHQSLGLSLFRVTDFLLNGVVLIVPKTQPIAMIGLPSMFSPCEFYRLVQRLIQKLNASWVALKNHPFGLHARNDFVEGSVHEFSLLIVNLVCRLPSVPRHPKT